MWRTLTPALTLLTATTLSDAMPAMDLGAAVRMRQNVRRGILYVYHVLRF